MGKIAVVYWSGTGNTEANSVITNGSPDESAAKKCEAMGKTLV